MSTTVVAEPVTQLVQYSAPAFQQFQPVATTYAAPAAGQTFQHQGLTLKVAGAAPTVQPGQTFQHQGLQLQVAGQAPGQVFQHQGLQLQVAGQAAPMPQPGQVFQHQGMQFKIAAPASAPTSVQIPAATSMQIPAQTQVMARPAGFPRGPQDLLAKGQLIIEQGVTREYLIETGNLIIDERADAAVNAQLDRMQAQFLPIGDAVAEPVAGGGHYMQAEIGGQEVIGGHDMPPMHHGAHGAELTCEWMFGDVATGFLGIHALAHLNPLRWSGPLVLDEALQQLTDVQTHHDRPISLKIPANSGLGQEEHPNAGAAIQRILQEQAAYQ